MHLFLIAKSIVSVMECDVVGHDRSGRDDVSSGSRLLALRRHGLLVTGVTRAGSDSSIGALAVGRSGSLMICMAGSEELGRIDGPGIDMSREMSRSSGLCFWTVRISITGPMPEV